MLFVGLVSRTDVATAQQVEVGASVGFGMPGSEGSLIGLAVRPVSGVHASVWWDDRVETALRLAWQWLPELHAGAEYGVGCGAGVPPGCQRPIVRVFFRGANPRRFTAFELLYHARPGSRVRPLFGFGIGRIDRTETTVCEGAGCEALLPFVGTTRRYSAGDVIGVVGASSVVGKHLILRGAVHFHRPGGEDLSMFETAFTVGYRF
jgi:hypothetical protein